MLQDRQICALAAVLALFPALTNAQGPEAVAINAPFIATPDEVVTAMLRLAGVTSRDIVYDLGCGDGRIVIAAARQYRARGVGIDINPARLAEARANARKAGVEALVSFEQNDLYAVDLRNANVVTLYLLADANLRLRPKLLRELKPGARVVSHSFSMGDWRPEKEESVGGSRIYLWTIKGPQ